MAADSDALDAAVGRFEEELTKRQTPRIFAPVAEAYRLKGMPEQAANVARQGLRAYPEHAAIMVVLARSLADAGRSDEARAAYGRVLSVDRENEEARRFLGMTDDADRERPREQGSTATAEPRTCGTLSEELACLDDLFTIGASGRAFGDEENLDGIATLTLAEIYAKQGLIEQAIEVCEKIVAGNPGDEAARIRLEELRTELRANHST